MFRNLVALNAEVHRDLRFTPNQPFDFARDQVLIPITAAEVQKIARELVIVFPVQKGVPQAVAGVEPGQSLHITDEGHWLGRYVPAHLRRYPFVLAEKPTTAEQRAKTGRQYVVQFDADARHFEGSEGVALLDSEGKPTELLQKVQKVLMQMNHDQERTQEMIEQLDESGLLVERQIRVTPKDGQPVVLTGFRLIDVKALAALEPTRLAALRSSGALTLAYAHLMSLSNLEDGWIVKARAGGREPRVALEEIFRGEDDFTFDFDSVTPDSSQKH